MAEVNHRLAGDSTHGDEGNIRPPKDASDRTEAAHREPPFGALTHALPRDPPILSR